MDRITTPVGDFGGIAPCALDSATADRLWAMASS